MDSEANRYEIEAKIEPSFFAAMQKMTPEQQQQQVALMEQSLLAERFHLKVQFEIRGETPVYALVIAKGGLKLTAAKKGEVTQFSSRSRNEITGQAVTLDQFVHSPLWTPVGDRFVVDQTGLTGTYDFILRWRSDPFEPEAGTASEDLPPLFNALREQLGLNLVDSKAPLEVIVIDHIERPSQN